MKAAPDTLTVTDVSHVLVTSAESVRAWADRGLLPVTRTPRGTRIFRRLDVLAFAADRKRTRQKPATVPA